MSGPRLVHLLEHIVLLLLVSSPHLIQCIGQFLVEHFVLLALFVQLLHKIFFLVDGYLQQILKLLLVVLQ